MLNSLDEKLLVISNFQPLIENQKQTNEETLKSMEDIATRLNQDYETIKLISNQQAQQINSFSNITEKLKKMQVLLWNKVLNLQYEET